MSTNKNQSSESPIKKKSLDGLGGVLEPKPTSKVVSNIPAKSPQTSGGAKKG